MKTIIVAGLLVLAVVAAQEYRISRAENALQNAEKNNRDLNDQLSDLLSDNASIYSALLQSRAQTEALSKAHLLARQNLQRAERNHAAALQQLAEYRKKPDYAAWADNAVPAAAEHWLRQLSTDGQPSHRTSGANTGTGETDSAAASPGNTPGEAQQ